MAGKNRDINIFGLSFMDVLANTIGGLAFLLIMSVLMVGAVVQFVEPKITTESLPDGYVGRSYDIWLAAREGMGKYEWSVVEGKGELPAGLALDQEAGRLSGTFEQPDGVAGSKQFEFEIRCVSTAPASADKSQEDIQRYTLRLVGEASDSTPLPVRITTETTLPDAYRGQTYPLVFAAVGGQPPYNWRLRGTVPEGFTLSADGRVTGSPQAAGAFQFEVGVATAQGERAIKQMQLTVSEKHPPPPPAIPLRIVTKEVAPAVSLQSYDVSLAGEGGQPPYRWSIQKGGLTWLQPNATQSGFGGKPVVKDVGKSDVVWRVTDAKGTTVDSQPISLEVLPPIGPIPEPLKIKTEMLPDARVGEPYSVAVALQGGIPPFHWSIDAKESWAAIAFSTETGTFAGTPTRTDKHQAKVRVTDSTNASASVDLALKIRPAIDPIRIMTTQAPDGRVGEQYELALSAQGGLPPYSWKHLNGELPVGLTFDAERGMLVGTPSEVNQWTANFIVQDGQGQRPEKAVELSVRVLSPEGHTRLQVKTKSIPLLLQGKPVDFAFACEGGKPPYRCEISGESPRGLKAQGGAIVGSPESAGTYATSFRISDAESQMVTVDLPVEVQAVVAAWWFWTAAGIAAVSLLAALLLARQSASRKALPLKVNSTSVPNGRASCDYAVQLSCLGGTAPFKWQLIEGSLPPGMILSDEGMLSGCPLEGIGISETKDFAFTVEVRDAQGATARQAL